MLAAPELLTAAHEVSSFSCGRPVLDRWLKTRARANQRGLTVVMVVHEAGRVVGSMALRPRPSCRRRCRAIRTGQPPSPVPCLLLG